MRLFIPFLLLSGAAVLMPDQSFAQREVRPHQGAPVYSYCHRQAMSGSINCGFTSMQQCMATASGDGGDCIRNPALSNRWR